MTARGPAPDRDRERAGRALRWQLGAEDVERVAAALADERLRVVQRFIALAIQWHQTAENTSDDGAIHARHAAAILDIAEEIL